MGQSSGKGKENRRFRNIAVGLLIAVLLVFCYAGISVWREYKNTIIDNQKQQMLLTVQSLADSLEMVIQEYEEDLESFCLLAERKKGQSAGEEQSGKKKQSGKEEQSGEKEWPELREYVASHSHFVYDAVLQDSEGNVEESVKDTWIEHIYSTARINEQTVLYQARFTDNEIYLVIRRTVETGGAFSIVIDSNAYYESMISGIRLGTNGYVVVKDSSGIILMHPSREQWGINVIEGRKMLYPNANLDSLNKMIEEQNQGKTGVSEYYSYWWLKQDAPRVKKIAAYAPARIGEDFLVVSTVIDYNDVYIPIAQGVFRLLLIFVGIVCVLSGVGIYVFHLLIRQKKDTEQIAYLTELNRILEEMHRSEETIAHQQRLQIMGTMTGGIAHEFNNLLTPIMGYADLLMMELPEDSDAYDSASEIYAASEKAKEIIQQISSLSRKNMETAYKNLPCRKVMTRALKMVQSVCPANVRLEQDIRLKEECILGNETQLNQVILNICVNAIHAIGHKDGILEVSCRAVERKHLEEAGISSVPDTWSRYMEINIRDNGCGMSDDVMKQIFDPFFTTKKGGKGTGLGLALVEQIVSSHRGYIRVESRLGEGSVFHLYFPVSEQEEQEMHSGEQGGSQPIMNILMVDDNPKVLKLFERNFGKLGITVVPAMDFEEAKGLLKEKTFDAVAAEQYINGKSAVDFCMSVQGQYPGLVKIIMAEQVTKELAEAGQRGIIQAYILKPVSDAAILKVIRDSREGGNLNNY